MKKFMWIISWVVVLGLLGFGIYKFFIDCDKIETEYDRYFTLGEMDYAVANEDVTVKLLDLKNDKDTGQYLVRLLVYNDAKIAYVELGSIDPTIVMTDKISLEYTISLIRIEDDTATLTIHPTTSEEQDNL